MVRRQNRLMGVCALALAVAAGCGTTETRIYGPAAGLADGSTFAVTVPPDSGPAEVGLTSPVAWNETVLVLNGRDLALTEPVVDDAILKTAGGYVFRHAARVPSHTQVTIPADAFLSPTGAHYDARRDAPKSLDAFYRTTGGDYIHWRAPLIVLQE